MVFIFLAPADSLSCWFVGINYFYGCSLLLSFSWCFKISASPTYPPVQCLHDTTKPFGRPYFANLGNFKVEQKEASHIGIQFISGLFHPWKNNWFIKFFISWWNCMISRKRLTRIVDSDTVYKLRLCVWIVHVTKILHAYIYRRKCLAMADWLNPRQWKLIGGLLFCKRANGGSLVSSNDYLRGSRYKRLPL